MNNTFCFHYELLLMIPTLLLYAGVVGVKWKDKRMADLPFITLLLLTQVLCAVSMSIATHGEAIPEVLWEVQSIITCFVIPFGYAYLCRLCGAESWDGVTIHTLVLVLFVLVPQLDIQLSTGDVVIGRGYTHIINLYQEGKLMLSFYITNFVIILQTLVAFTQIPRAVRTAKRYRINVSKKAKVVCYWWLVSFACVMLIAFIPASFFLQPALRWGHLIVYACLSAGFFLLLLKRYDVDAVTTEGKQMEDFSERVNDFSDIARRVRVLFEEKKYYQQEVTLDDVADRLSTNRTYLTQVMRSEFDTSFANYVITLRIEHSKELLSNTNDTLETIAKQSGFNSAAAFCRAFKREVGTTPDMWRREMRLRKEDEEEE